MLSFFRINDPYRLIFVFLILIALRLPYLIAGIPLLIPELNWMLVGTAMSEGKMMYRDIWEHMGPLSALTYQVIDQLFGQSQLAYQCFSIIVVFLQAVIFNRMLLNNKAYNENSYVPGLLYVLCLCSNFEFLTLSPQLMATTFILLAINNIFKRIDNYTRDELFLNTGLYLGLAALFHFPSFVFLISTMGSLILFTNAIPRRLWLLLFGFMQLILVALLYYFWFDAGREFYHQFIRSYFTLDHLALLPLKSVLLIFLIPGIFLVLAFVKLSRRTYYVNYQIKFQSVMSITFLVAIATLFLEPKLSTIGLIYFFPSVAFYLSHFFLLIEKRFKAEIAFLLFLGISLTYQIIIDKDVRWLGQLVTYEPLYTNTSSHQSVVRGKKVLVLGEDISHYNTASLATPYLNWALSQTHFQKLHYYDVLTDVFKNFDGDLPEVIIDLEGLGPYLMDQMPTVAKRYHRVSSQLYILNN